MRGRNLRTQIHRCQQHTRCSSQNARGYPVLVPEKSCEEPKCVLFKAQDLSEQNHKLAIKCQTIQCFKYKSNQNFLGLQTSKSAIALDFIKLRCRLRNWALCVCLWEGTPSSISCFIHVSKVATCIAQKEDTDFHQTCTC